MNDDPGPYKFFRSCVRPWGLITAGGTIACAGTIFGFLGRFSWFFDIFSHFRVQYCLGLTAVASLLLIPRNRKTALFFAAFALINLLTFLPVFFNRQAHPEQARNTLRIVLSNVNSRAGKPELVAKMIKDCSPDILVLEEITSNWLDALKPDLTAYPYTKVSPRFDNFGIGLFSKLRLTDDTIAILGSAGLPSIIANVHTENGIITIIATHPLPPAGAEYSRLRNEQLEKLANHIKQIDQPVLLLGDLNVTPWNYYFKRLTEQTGLQDSSKGRRIQTTWPRFNPLMRIPIDHCLHSPAIIITDKQIGPNIGSDHLPVIIDFVP